MRSYKQIIVLISVIFVLSFAYSNEHKPLAELYKTGKVRFVQELVLDDRSMPKDVLFAGPASLACDSVLLAQAPPWKGKIVKEGDVTVVQNPKDPIYREPILTLREELVLDGGKAQGEAVFSSARSIAVDYEGNIYVGDMQQACIKVFDKAGAYVRTIGRRGQGPGELTLVDSIAVSGDNREVIVGDVSKLTIFDLQGRFKRNLASRGLSAVTNLDEQGNVFVSISDIRERRSIYRIFNPDMTKVLADIAVIPDPPDRNMYSPRAYWILDPQVRL